MISPSWTNHPVAGRDELRDLCSRQADKVSPEPFRKLDLQLHHGYGKV